MCIIDGPIKTGCLAVCFKHLMFERGKGNKNVTASIGGINYQALNRTFVMKICEKVG